MRMWSTSSQREEREVFEKLSTPEEKEQFIEQFWRRRDPDPRTAVNEFKEEHYRRIAYANEHFFWAKPGWMTDRGRIYIIHGPPDEIESHPTGGPYDRPIHEGGGTTVTYPFEIWRYRYIEGIGPNVELEFVDPSLTHEYRLALLPEEKDALLTTPGVGLTLAEESWDMLKEDGRLARPYFSHDARINNAYPGMFQRAQDLPWERFRRYIQVQRAPKIHYKDLKQVVRTNIIYEHLPFDVRIDYLRLDERCYAVPITVQVPNRELMFVSERGQRVARMAIYGLVTTLTGAVVAEFEDEVRSEFSDNMFPHCLEQSSIYQKVISLDPKTRHKIDLVVKDLESGKLGVLRRALDVPPYLSAPLARSTLILADSIQPVGETAPLEGMFVLGDLKVRPSVSLEFAKGASLNVYLQVYNAAVDQATQLPLLEVKYRIVQEGRTITEIVDKRGRSVQYFLLGVSSWCGAFR